MKHDDSAVQRYVDVCFDGVEEAREKNQLCVRTFRLWQRGREEREGKWNNVCSLGVHTQRTPSIASVSRQFCRRCRRNCRNDLDAKGNERSIPLSMPSAPSRIACWKDARVFLWWNVSKKASLGHVSAYSGYAADA